MAGMEGERGASLTAVGLSRTYHSGNQKIEVLKELQLTLEPGEVIAILGASGSGKSTLLHILGGLDRPDEGSIFYSGQDISALDEEGRAMMRNRHIGFIFQYHHLLAEFSALENVQIPLYIGGADQSFIRKRALDLLDMVGLADRAEHLPGQLSGGEQQRVALARALANDPPVVLADEPTGNLDRETGEGIFKLLYSLARNGNKSWVVATHNEYLAQLADNKMRLEDGALRLVKGD